MKNIKKKHETNEKMSAWNSLGFGCAKLCALAWASVHVSAFKTIMLSNIVFLRLIGRVRFNRRSQRKTKEKNINSILSHFSLSFSLHPFISRPLYNTLVGRDHSVDWFLKSNRSFFDSFVIHFYFLFFPFCNWRASYWPHDIYSTERKKSSAATRISALTHAHVCVSFIWWGNKKWSIKIDERIALTHRTTTTTSHHSRLEGDEKIKRERRNKRSATQQWRMLNDKCRQQHDELKSNQRPMRWKETTHEWNKNKNKRKKTCK